MLGCLDARLKDGPEKAARDAFEKAMLPRLVAKRRELAKGKTVTDLRLEMRRKEASQFSKAERRQYELVKEDADRTQDPEEQASLERILL